MPGKPSKLKFKEFQRNADALSGMDKRSQVTVYFNGKENGPSMDILLYLPNTNKPVPIFLKLTFQGNHAVNDDPEI